MSKKEKTPEKVEEVTTEKKLGLKGLNGADIKVGDVVYVENLYRYVKIGEDGKGVDLQGNKYSMSGTLNLIKNKKVIKKIGFGGK